MIARLEERVQVRMLQQRKTPAAKKKQRHDGELVKGNFDELMNPTLPRKTSSETRSARTVNRHR